MLALTRFLGNISIGDGCWVWLRPLDSDGYGIFKVNGKAMKVHRYAYELVVGPIPEGLVIDHLCRNRACVKPAHMEPVTAVENSRRQIKKTSCNYGHPLSGDNVGILRRSGYRYCRECSRKRTREWKQRKQAAA